VAVATDTLSTRELDAFREAADRFIAAIDDEYYQHYAGLKESLEIYEI
jgi:tRNA U34 5-methylaminomethyl-2-thiouridine-forming methyltransferase MnmC